MLPSHRIELQAGYVLHRRPYRETSLLVDVFSQDYGKMALLAKGARRAKGRNASVPLVPFRPLLLSWSGKSDMPLLTAVDAAESMPLLQGTALYCGLYVNELLQVFLHRHDPHPDLYRQYAFTLAQLAGSDDQETVLRDFELTMLEELGYGLQLHSDADTGLDIDPGAYYRYIPERGAIAASSGEGAILGATLIGLRERQLVDRDSRREAKQLLRRIIHHHLAGRPLRSRELFRYSKPHESH